MSRLAPNAFILLQVISSLLCRFESAATTFGLRFMNHRSLIKNEWNSKIGTHSVWFLRHRPPIGLIRISEASARWLEDQWRTVRKVPQDQWRSSKAPRYYSSTMITITVPLLLNCYYFHLIIRCNLEQTLVTLFSIISYLDTFLLIIFRKYFTTLTYDNKGSWLAITSVLLHRLLLEKTDKRTI